MKEEDISKVCALILGLYARQKPDQVVLEMKVDNLRNMFEEKRKVQDVQQICISKATVESKTSLPSPTIIAPVIDKMELQEESNTPAPTIKSEITKIREIKIIKRSKSRSSSITSDKGNSRENSPKSKAPRYKNRPRSRSHDEYPEKRHSHHKDSRDGRSRNRERYNRDYDYERRSPRESRDRDRSRSDYYHSDRKRSRRHQSRDRY